MKTFKKLERKLQQKDLSDWNTERWTKAVLTAMCATGRKLECTVGASPRFVSAKHRDGGEWLYDATWCSHDDDGWFKAVELAAESEWSSLERIEEDFQKLLQARATIRVMVFDAGQCDGGADAIAERLCKHVRAFRGTKGDSYVLIAYAEDEESWWFDYSLIQAGAPGALPTFQRL